jgi:hypothetical protein
VSGITKKAPLAGGFFVGHGHSLPDGDDSYYILGYTESGLRIMAEELTKDEAEARAQEVARRLMSTPHKPQKILKRPKPAANPTSSTGPATPVKDRLGR